MEESKSTKSHKTMNGLDPVDWEADRKLAHKMVDDMFDYLSGLSSRKENVWQSVPVVVKSKFAQESPKSPSSLESVYSTIFTSCFPHTTGNNNPGFCSWVQGGGSVAGMLGEMICGGLNMSNWGGDNASVMVEHQVVEWVKNWFHFPQQAKGLFVTGSSMANFMALLSAKAHVLGTSVRKTGIQNESECVMFCAASVHGCVHKAAEMSGFGSNALIEIPICDNFQIDVAALRARLEESVAAKKIPIMVVVSAGTVDVGAIDDFHAVADVCREFDVWMHVDGAYGALGMLSPEIAPKLSGIERADSIAFDFHKWGQVPYEAGFLLTRDGSLLKQAFVQGDSLKYMNRDPRGMATGEYWPCEHGPDLSRNCKALKTWMTIQTYGTAAMGDVMSNCCHVARYLVGLVEAHESLELLAPAALSIVVFRYKCKHHSNVDDVNKNIVWDLQEQGVVAPSFTFIRGVVAIRAAIVNHRTRELDMFNLVQNAVMFGKQRDVASN